MIELLVLLSIAGAVLLVIGGILAWPLYLLPKRQGERWAAAAHALGLTLEPRTAAHRVGLYGSGPVITQRMYGTRAGMEVCVGIRVEVRGSGDDRSVTYYTYVEVQLPRPLELGLNVTPSGALDVLADLVGSRDLQVGHPAIDSRYRIHAAVADQARALLLLPYVGEALLALSSSAFRPHLSDASVKLEAHKKELDPRSLSIVIDQAVDVAHRVVSARSSLGPSFVERVLTEAWRPVAEARGFMLDTGRRAIMGRAEGVHVAVHATQQGDACTTSFIVHFDRPLGLGLSLERQQGFSRVVAFFGQDILVGDPDFDARFIVKGGPSEAVRRVLTPEVRARLIALQEQATSLLVRDDALRADVGWLVTEPAWLHAGIIAIAQAGAALSRTGEVDVGPYRR